jgi:hypothetical protein
VCRNATGRKDRRFGDADTHAVHEALEIRRAKNRSNVAEYRQKASRGRPKIGDVTDPGVQETSDFQGIGLSSGEGIGRKRNTRDGSGKCGVMFQTVLGVSSFSFLECFALTEKAVGLFGVWIR